MIEKNDKSINIEEFIKYHLKEFFTQYLNKSLILLLKDYNINQNIIFRVKDFELIKQIMTILLMKEEKLKDINFYSSGIYKVVQDGFEKNIGLGTEYLESVQLLVLYELNDMEHKLYESVIGNLISIRLMNNLKTIIFLTTKPINKIVENKNITDKFIYKEISINSVKGKVEINNGVSIVRDVF